MPSMQRILTTFYEQSKTVENILLIEKILNFLFLYCWAKFVIEFFEVKKSAQHIIESKNAKKKKKNKI